jgi:hypothetical protein
MQADVQLPPELATCAPLLNGAPARLMVEAGASWVKGMASGRHELICP